MCSKLFIALDAVFRLGFFFSFLSTMKGMDGQGPSWNREMALPRLGCHKHLTVACVY